MTLTTEDQLELSQMGSAAHREVFRWIELLRPVADVHAAGGGLVVAIQRAARAAGIAEPTLRRKWYAWQKEGWKGLVNWAKCPAHREVGLPQAFLNEWKKIQGDHQRDTTGKAAHKALVKRWREWRKGDDSQALPGYDAPPTPETYTGLPQGWSYANLMKQGASRYEKRLRRQGTSAAKMLLPSVRTTRVGLQFMEMIMFDDQWHDTHVNFIGANGQVINNRMMRPLSFNALDVLSGCDFTRGYKPIIWDAATETRKMLTEQDFFWFLLHVLTEFGWREDIGTTIVHEHGTANVSSLSREAIVRATGGKVRFSASGIMGAPLHKGLMFAGQGKGNPKFKAHRESWFNLFRNAMSGVKGATGLDADHAPEENYGLSQYNNMLLRAIPKLRPERAALLRLPVLNWHQYQPLAESIAEAVNQRIDHNLEGWEQLGFLAHEVRLNLESEHFLSLSDVSTLEPQVQAIALDLMGKPGFGRIRNMSPREVFDGLRMDAPMAKMSPHLWNIVIPNDYAHVTSVTARHEIIIRDRAVSPEPMVFAALAKTQRGREEIIPAGTKVRVYLNPYRPERILVCEPNDAAIGLAERINTPCRNDLDGMARVAGAVSHVEAHLQRPVVQRTQGLAEERQAMREHNQRVIDGEAVTDGEREAERKNERAAGIADRVLNAGEGIRDKGQGIRPGPEVLAEPVGDWDPLDG